MDPIKSELRIGESDKAHLRITILGFVHPDIAEPDGMDLLDTHVHVEAAPVVATFPLAIRAGDLFDIRDYLEQINSGNGPQAEFALADGLAHLAFAPSRRGPILVAATLKSIERSHVRLEYLITLEPESITRLRNELTALEAAVKM